MFNFLCLSIFKLLACLRYGKFTPSYMYLIQYKPYYNYATALSSLFNICSSSRTNLYGQNILFEMCGFSNGFSIMWYGMLSYPARQNATQLPILLILCHYRNPLDYTTYYSRLLTSCTDIQILCCLFVVGIFRKFLDLLANLLDLLPHLLGHFILSGRVYTHVAYVTLTCMQQSQCVIFFARFQCTFLVYENAKPIFSCWREREKKYFFASAKKEYAYGMFWPTFIWVICQKLQNLNY